MSHKYTWLFSILGVALCSGLASAHRQATVRFEIPGYKTPANDHERKWYVYFASGNPSVTPYQGIIGATGITPGILFEIKSHNISVDPHTGIGSFEFRFESTGATTAGAILYIAYGFAPEGACCVNSVSCTDNITQSDCYNMDGTWYTPGEGCQGTECPAGNPWDAASNPLQPHMDHMWYTEAEFIFNPTDHPGTHDGDLGDITYVAQFSHPMAAVVYGSSDGTHWGDPVSRHVPDQMVKQILINEIYLSDGFKGDGDINTSSLAFGDPPVWISGGVGVSANTKLWQDPNIQGQAWDPHTADGFIRINQPNVVFKTLAAGYKILPGYVDAMELLYQKYPNTGQNAILIGGNYSAQCNSQNLYSVPDPAGTLCTVAECEHAHHHPPFQGGSDIYRVWARVGRKSGGSGDSEPPYAYWFEVTATDPATGDAGFIAVPGGFPLGHVTPPEILYMPQNAHPAGVATAAEINANLFGRLVSGSPASSGGSMPILPEMSWMASGQNVFTIANPYSASAVAIVRDICATVSTGVLGSEVDIGYAFTSDSGTGKEGYFFVNGIPNSRGITIPGAQYSSNYHLGSQCCCVPDWITNDSGASFAGFSGTTATGGLATGQLGWLNNWFEDMHPGTSSKPWNESYRVLFDLLGSSVYTCNYTDYYKYYGSLNPQFATNSHEYMKYVFTLGTMQFADLAGGSTSGTSHEGDGIVGVLDLLYLLQHWGPDGNADLNSDQKVNAVDMILLLNNWTGPAFATGACCINQVCSIRSSQDCLNLTGTYKGNWTHCDPNPCSN